MVAAAEASDRVLDVAFNYRERGDVDQLLVRAAREPSAGKSREEPLAPIVAGDRIGLAANLQRLHFFDLGTGQAIRDDG